MRKIFGLIPEKWSGTAFVIGAVFLGFLIADLVEKFFRPLVGFEPLIWLVPYLAIMVWIFVKWLKKSW